MSQINTLQITARDFELSVWILKDMKNISFVQSVYQLLDDSVKEETRIADLVFVCKSGCSTCCHQIIACTEIEMDEIIKFVGYLQRDKRITILRRMRDAGIQWRNYYEKEGHKLNYDKLKYWRDWVNKPCPFLNPISGACDIYPVRIMDCRTLTSEIPCSQIIENSVKPKRFRFQVDTFANNIIWEEQVRISNSRGVQAVVMPLHNWLLIRRKELGY